MIETAATVYVWTNLYIPIIIVMIFISLMIYIHSSSKRWYMKRHMDKTKCKGSFRVGYKKEFKGIMFGTKEYNVSHYCYRCKKWF